MPLPEDGQKKRGRSRGKQRCKEKAGRFQIHTSFPARRCFAGVFRLILLEYIRYAKGKAAGLLAPAGENMIILESRDTGMKPGSPKRI